MFDGSEHSRKIALTGVDKFLSRRSTFWGMQKMGGQNQISRVIKTHLEIFLFLLDYLNRTCSFHFNSASIEGFLQLNFCPLNVILMSKIRCVSKNNFHTSDVSVQLPRRIRWKHGILLKINSTTNVLTIICRNLSE